MNLLRTAKAAFADGLITKEVYDLQTAGANKVLQTPLPASPREVVHSTPHSAALVPPVAGFGTVQPALTRRGSLVGELRRDDDGR